MALFWVWDSDLFANSLGLVAVLPCKSSFRGVAEPGWSEVVLLIRGCI